MTMKSIHRFTRGWRLYAAVSAAFFASMLFVASALTNGYADANVTITPDPNVQAQIQRALSPQTTKEPGRQIELLLETVGSKHEVLVPQLVYYTVYGKDAEGRHDVREGMALAVIADQLKISEQTIVRSLLPYLNTKDTALHDQLKRVLEGPNFLVFQNVIEERLRASQEPPPELIRIMYERNAGEALLTLARTPLLGPTGKERTQKWRALLLAEHVIADTLWKHEHGFLDKTKVEPEAMVQLEKLSKDDAWWARLYAAEIVQRHPAFRTPELVKRLSDDASPLVKEAMGFARESPKEKGPPRVAPPERPAPARPETK